MAANPHFSELLLRFNEKEAEFLVVGGYARMKYSEPRFTKDLDLWVNNSARNAARVYAALADFGAPLQKDGLRPQDFSSSDLIYQIGVAPVRVDVMTWISGVSFTEAWPRRVAGSLFGVPVFFLALQDLKSNKRATGRAQDLDQLKGLEAED